MEQIILHDVPITRILEIVYELKHSGLKQGHEFDFEFHQQRFVYEANQLLPNYTIFYFYKPGYATMFALRYS